MILPIWLKSLSNKQSICKEMMFLIQELLRLLKLNRRKNRLNLKSLSHLELREYLCARTRVFLKSREDNLLQDPHSYQICLPTLTWIPTKTVSSTYQELTWTLLMSLMTPLTSHHPHCWAMDFLNSRIETFQAFLNNTGRLSFHLVLFKIRESMIASSAETNSKFLKARAIFWAHLI